MNIYVYIVKPIIYTKNRDKFHTLTRQYGVIKNMTGDSKLHPELLCLKNKPLEGRDHERRECMVWFRRLLNVSSSIVAPNLERRVIR